MIQKREDIVGSDVLEAQINDTAAMTHPEKAQQQHERIAVAQHGPRAEPP